jgi:pyruvate carboxylase
MLKGDLGQPPSGWPEALQKKALKGDAPYTVRPGSLLEDADLDAERKSIETKLEREVSDFEFASYLMYPKVFTDFALASDTYGPVSVLPTPAYFYGLADGQELFADIEKGKTLVIVNQAMSGTDSQGMVTVFFELNGQPRRIKVPDRAHGATGAAVRRKAEPGNATHVGAPMPGVISRVFVSPGQNVNAGDVLVSIEAMKMETAIHAEKDGAISEVLVKAGDQIDAKDLLVAYSG